MEVHSYTERGNLLGLICIFLAFSVVYSFWTYSICCRLGLNLVKVLWRFILLKIAVQLQLLVCPHTMLLR